MNMFFVLFKKLACIIAALIVAGLIVFFRTWFIAVFTNVFKEQGANFIVGASAILEILFFILIFYIPIKIYKFLISLPGKEK